MDALVNAPCIPLSVDTEAVYKVDTLAALDMEVETFFGKVVCSDRGGHEGGNGTG